MSVKNIGLILSFIVFSASMFAQESSQKLSEMDLDDLLNIKIVTASKSEEKLSDAAATVSVINSRQIESYGAMKFADLLDRVTSMYFIGSYQFQMNMPSLRGINAAQYSTQILVLLDGRPVRESLFNGYNSPVFTSFPVSSIERIEVVRGPGSVLYGTCAFAGVINIITKTPDSRNEQPLAAASTSIGSFNTKDINIYAGKSFNEFKISGSMMYQNSDGYDLRMIDEKGKTIGFKSGNLSFGGTAKIQYKDLTINGFYADNDLPGTGRTPVYDSVKYLAKAKRLFLDGGYQTSVTDNWDLGLNLTYNRFLQRNTRGGNATTDSSIINDYIIELSNTLTPVENLSIIIGGLLNHQSGFRYVLDRTANDVAYNVLTKPYNTNPFKSVPNYSETWWSAYLQATYEVVQGIKVIGGGQFNKVTGISWDFVPRLAGIVEINSNLTGKLMYGQAFRSSSAFERYSKAVSVFGNPNLLAEKVGTFEAQLYYSESNAEGVLTFFRSKVTNQITRSLASDKLAFDKNGNPVPLVINRGGLTVNGVELEGKYILSGDFSAEASMTYQHNKDQAGVEGVTGMPQFIIKAGLSYNSPFGLSLGLFNSYYSKATEITIYDSKTGAAITKNVNPVADAFSYMTLNMNLNIRSLLDNSSIPDFNIFVYGDNMLDSKVYYPEYIRKNINSIPGRGGRALYAGLGIKF